MNYKEASEYLITKALTSGDGEMLKAIKIIMDTEKICGFCGQDETADHNGCLQILSTRRS